MKKLIFVASLFASTVYAQDCANLASQAPASMALKAETFPDSPAIAAVGNVPALPALKAHCKLNGQIRERVGVSEKGEPRKFHIGFELRLPVDWNGRLLYQGGGGNDGIVRPAIGPQATGDVLALNRGFAVVTTDAGHQGP